MTTTSEKLPFAIGDVIGERYKLLHEPIQGGFAYIYKAFDQDLGREVALKILRKRSSLAWYWNDIQAEARRWASLKPHPNIVQLFDLGTDDKTRLNYLVLEWIDGPNLDEWRGGEGENQIRDMGLLLQLALECCRGLQAITESRLVHGDITPQNILLALQNGVHRPKITDFGLAWNIKSGGKPRRIGGTLKWAAPEQLVPRGQVDQRSDVYSLGAVLFYLFTGSYYLSDVNDDESILRKAIQEQPPLSLRSIQVASNTELDKLLAAMLDKQPMNRPTIDDIVARLLGIIDQYERPSLPQQIPEWQRALKAFQQKVFDIELRITYTAYEAASKELAPVLGRHPIVGREWEWVRDPDSLLQALVKHGVKYEWYAYNDGPGNSVGERRIRLYLASDSSNPSNKDYYCEPLGRALELQVIYNPAWRHLLVRKASLVPLANGFHKKNALCTFICVWTRYTGTPSKSTFPPEFVAAVERLPEGLEPDPEVQERIKHWETYLQLWEKLAKEKEYEIHYRSWEIDPRNSKLILFQLHGEIPWQRIKETRREQLVLRRYYSEEELVDRSLSGSGSRQDIDEYDDVRPAIGTIEKVYEEQRIISVRVDEEFVERHWDRQKQTLQIEDEGILAYVATGDLAQIGHQRRALEQFAKGDTPNLHLNQFMFDASRAGLPEEQSVKLDRKDLLLPDLNDNQLKAVEGALAAPDLFLIQGPPGTGKTTVIAELCYQFASRGQRVLVASQSNLAVDNALSRLAHHPRILPFRFGPEVSVEPEGKPFTEKEVVRNWFERTASDCEREIVKRNQRLESFGRLFTDMKRLECYRDHLVKAERKLPALRNELERLLAERQAKESELQSLTQRIESVPRVIKAVHSAERAVMLGTVPAFESHHEWRYAVTDLVAVAEYQDFLMAIRAASDTLTCLGVDVDETFSACLLPEEKSLLQKLHPQDRNPGLWSHRVTAMLLLGKRLAELMADHMPDTLQLVKYVDSLDEQIRDYRVSRSQLDKLRQLITLFEVRSSLDTISNAFERFETWMQEALQARTSFDSAQSAEAASRHALYVAKTRYDKLNEVMKQFRQAAEVHKAIVRKVAELAQLPSRLSAAKQALDQAWVSVVPLQQRKNERQQHLADAENFLAELHLARSRPEPYLSQVTQWLRQPNAVELISGWPKLLRDAVMNQTWIHDPVLALFKDVAELIASTLEKYRERVPDKDLQGDDEMQVDKHLPLHSAFEALFMRDGEYVYARDPSTTYSSVARLCASMLEGFPNKGRLRRGFRESQLVHIRHEYRYLEQLRENILHQHSLHWQRCVAQLDTAELRFQFLALIEELTASCRTSIATYRREVEEAADLLEATVMAEVRPYEEALESLLRTAHTLTAEIKASATQIDLVLGESLYAEVAETLSNIQWGAEPFGQQEVALCCEQLKIALARAKELNAVQRRDYDEATAKQEQLLEQVQSDADAWTKASHTLSTCMEQLRVSAEDFFQTLASQRDELVAWGFQQLIEEFQEIAKANSQNASTSGLTSLGHIRAALSAKQATTTEAIQTLAAEVNLLHPSRDSVEQALAEQTELTEKLSDDLLAHMTQVNKMYRGERSVAAVDQEKLDDWQAWIAQLRNAMKQLGSNTQYLNVERVIQAWLNLIEQYRQDLELQHTEVTNLIHELTRQCHNLEEEINRQDASLQVEQAWWASLYSAIPSHLVDSLPSSHSIHSPSFLDAVLSAVKTGAWEAEHAHQVQKVVKTGPFLKEWVERLRNAQPGDAKALQQTYIANANVIGVTCGRVPRLQRKMRELSLYDVVIVDEVSKATPPELLLPMLEGRKIILVGDHKQLPPMLNAETTVEVAEQLGISKSDIEHLKQSLFGNLYNTAPLILRQMLTEQYRMRKPIMRAINQFYDGQLTGGHDQPHGLTVSGIDPETALAWYVTPREQAYFEEQVGHSYRNLAEVKQIERLLAEMNASWEPMVAAGEPRKEVGVITFYAAQLQEFRQRFIGENYPALHLRIGTVDKFQGMERDVVIVSLVRNNAEGKIGFAREPERINVAFSRARELLVIVGCQALFTQYARNSYVATAAYGKVANVVRQEGREVDVSKLS